MFAAVGLTPAQITAAEEPLQRELLALESGEPAVRQRADATKKTRWLPRDEHFARARDADEA